MEGKRTPKRGGWKYVLLPALALFSISVAVFSLWLGRLRSHDQFVAKLQSLDEQMSLAHQQSGSPPPGNRWVRWMAGDNAFASVTSVRLRGEDGRRQLPRLCQQPGLETLQLKGASFDDADMQHVASAANLNLLRLEETGVTQTGLAQLRRCAALQYLTLQGAWVNDRVLSGLRDMKQLRGLTIESASITAAGLKHLSQLTQLEYLVVNECKNATGAGLSHLKDLTSLKQLFLRKTPLSDADLNSLRGMKQLNNLELSSELWNSQSAGTLATLPGLMRLDLRDVDVTDEDLPAIARITTLTWLRLGGSNVTDKGMKVIAQQMQLTYLSVGPGVTSAGVAAIHQRHPDCWIELVDAQGFFRTGGAAADAAAFQALDEVTP